METQNPTQQPTLSPATALPGSVRIEMRDPKDLKPHPAVQELFAWSEDDQSFLAFCDDIKEKGILDPLLVTDDNFIVDGRHRWRAANRWQFSHVPVRVLGGRNIEQIVLLQLSTLAHRRHYTPGQRAYVMYPFVRRAHAAALMTHEKNLKSGRASTISAESEMVGKKGGLKTTQELADELKLSRDTFDRAARLHQIFTDEAKPLKWDKDTLRKLHLSTKRKYTIREVFEPQIMDPLKPMGLGAAVAGISSVIDQDRKGQHGGGKPKEAERQLALFTDTFKDLSTRYEYWQAFDDSAKSAARKGMRASFEHMPDDLLKALTAELRAEMQRRSAESAGN